MRCTRRPFISGKVNTFTLTRKGVARLELVEELGVARDVRLLGPIALLAALLISERDDALEVVRTERAEHVVEVVALRQRLLLGVRGEIGGELAVLLQRIPQVVDRELVVLRDGEGLDVFALEELGGVSVLKCLALPSCRRP